jgi:hypothetical protein
MVSHDPHLPFSRKTIIAAADILKSLKHAGFNRLLLELALAGEKAGRGSGLLARANSLAQFVLNNPQVRTPDNRLVAIAIVERAAQLDKANKVLSNVTLEDRRAFREALAGDGWILYSRPAGSSFEAPGGVLRQMPPPASDPAPEVPPPGATALLSGSASAHAEGTGELSIEAVVHPATPLPTVPDEASLADDLPDFPTQGPGPHFELTKAGVIDFVPPEALDREGNNVERLRRLHPTLRDLARQLAKALGTGNVPHAHLAARMEAYRTRVDQPLDRIDFTLLYVEGVRLANAEKAAIEKVAEGELPPLRETDREELETLLQLHGTFMLATIAGAELTAAEQRYRRRPAEEREYRAAAVDFAASLQNQPDVINPDTAAFVLGAAEQIGHGANPERSGVVGTTTVLNVGITLAAVAAVPGLPFMGNLIAGTPGLIAGGAAAYITSEIVKRSRPFAAVIAPIIAKLDREVDFRKFKNFLLSVEQKMRRLANYNEQFSWLNNALHWIKGPVAGQHVMASAAFSGTAAMSSSSSPDDFVISLLNASGEIGISAQTERAQKARRLPDGETVAFNNRFEAIPYVQAAEAEGLTFSRKELLGPIIEQDSVGLEELDKAIKLQSIPFIQMLEDIGNNNEMMSVTIDILETASDKEDFLRKINEASSSKIAHRIENFLRAYEDARQDLNKARAVLGKEPFQF